MWICVYIGIAQFLPPTLTTLFLFLIGGIMNESWLFWGSKKNSFMCLLNPNFMWQLEHHYIVDCSAIFKLYYMLWGLSCYSQHIHRYFHLGILSVIVLLSIKFFVCFLEVIHHMFSGGMTLFPQILSTNLFWGQK